MVWCGQLWAFAWPQLMQASIVEPDVDSQKVVLEAIAESIEVHPKIRNQVQKTASAVQTVPGMGLRAFDFAECIRYPSPPALCEVRG